MFGNGQGAFSEKPALGFPNGGTINHRLGFYFTDAWKIKRSFTLSYGLRYDYDSALSDSDLARTPVLAKFNPALAGKPNNDTNNFAPQAGLAWDVERQWQVCGPRWRRDFLRNQHHQQFPLRPRAQPAARIW